MTVLRSTLDAGSPPTPRPPSAMTAKLAELDAEHAKALAGGGPKYVDRHHAAASSRRANASSCCSTPTRRSWS